MSAKKAHWFRNVLYNQEFKLYDHFSAKSKEEPFAVVRAFPEEDYIKESHLRDVCLRYYENSIFDYFKISLTAYMRLPMPYSRELDRIANNSIRPLETARKDRENRMYTDSLNLSKREKS